MSSSQAIPKTDTVEKKDSNGVNTFFYEYTYIMKFN